MKLGTKIGWILVAFSIVLSVWVISGFGSKAVQTENDYTVSDAGELIGYPTIGGIIQIPQSIGGIKVTSIQTGLFSDNVNISTVEMPDSITSMGESVFSGCASLGSVRLSQGLTSIPAKTFYGCTNLSSVSLGNSITNIGSQAFYQSGITSITIPRSVAGIASDAFDLCPALISINVDAGNGNWSSYDGCLYNVGGTILNRCPEGKAELNLASTCTKINTDALKNCNNMSSVTIPANVEVLDQSNWTPDVIYCYSGSSAHLYAQSKGLNYELLDATEDNSNSGNTDSGNTDTGNTDTGNTDSGNTGTTDASSSSTSTTTNTGTSTSATNYTVKFNLNGGTGNSTTQTVAAGGHATNPGNPTKNGCTFMGWDYGSAAGDLWNFETYTVDFNVSLTAVWKNADGSIDKGTKTTKTGGSSGNGGHVKDSTPKTADGDIDPRYFLSFSFLLVGIAAILYSKRQKTQMIAERRNR